MSQLVPRIRGRAMQDDDGQWYYDIFITIGEDSENNDPLVLTPKERYLNKTTALAKMHAQIPEIVNVVCSAMKLPKPNGVLDLKKNRSMSFDDFVQSGLPSSLQKKEAK